MRFSVTFLIIGLLSLGVESAPFTDSGARTLQCCQLACKFLNVILRGQVSFPQSPIYVQENAYWSAQQAAVQSTCRVTASSSKDVAAALSVLKAQRCQFAVKSGGHAAFAGASNIEGGVTIDLAGMKEVTVSEDKKVTRVGPGNLWGDVYSKLDAKNLSVVGGRDSTVGVGGLLLGGGISFFSGLRGFGCDNVRNFEVVFADGSIHNVNPTSYADMYWALRGGGNNFGIVTRFDLETFPQGQLSGGATYYASTAEIDAAMFKALEEFTIQAPEDPRAAVYVVNGFSMGQPLVLAQLQYSEPVLNPPIYDSFMKIPSLFNTRRISSLTNFTAEIAGPYGLRQTYWAFTVRNNAALMSSVKAIWTEEVFPLIDIPGALPVIAFQPITEAIISNFAKHGGNALGISPEDGPLTIINISFRWNSSTDDSVVLASQRNTINRARVAAQAKGLDFRWIYQNYAAQEQDVFPGYGSVNHERLRQIAKKYDPSGVFQDLQPGYFKLF